VKVGDNILDFDQEIGVMGITDKVELHWREIGTDEVWPNEQMRGRGMTGRNFEDIDLSLEVPGGEVGGQASMTDGIVELCGARRAVAQGVELERSPSPDAADHPEEEKCDQHAEPDEDERVPLLWEGSKITSRVVRFRLSLWCGDDPFLNLRSDGTMAQCASGHAHRHRESSSKKMRHTTVAGSTLRGISAVLSVTEMRNTDHPFFHDLFHGSGWEG
jgi:hypothetical protein